MTRFKKLILTAIILFLSAPIASIALGAQEVGFVNSNIWLSSESILAGDNVQIYSIVVNSDANNLTGVLTFFDNGNALTGGENFNLAGGTESSQVFKISWQAVAGNHQFQAKISNAFFVNGQGQISPAANIINETTKTIFVDIDSDSDGVGDQEEGDNGTNPNNPDTDGDGENDSQDPNPSNPAVFGGADTDHDGIPDAIDSDSDNDGLYNWEETASDSNPIIYDTDHDGCSDKEDYYPIDPARCKQESPLINNNLNQENNLENQATTTDNANFENNQQSNQNLDSAGQVLGERFYNQNNSFWDQLNFLDILKILAAISGLLALIFWWFGQKKKKEEEENNKEK